LRNAKPPITILTRLKDSPDSVEGLVTSTLGASKGPRSRLQPVTGLFPLRSICKPRGRSCEWVDVWGARPKDATAAYYDWLLREAPTVSDRAANRAGLFWRYRAAQPCRYRATPMPMRVPQFSSPTVPPYPTP